MGSGGLDIWQLQFLMDCAFLFPANTTPSVESADASNNKTAGCCSMMSCAMTDSAALQLRYCAGSCGACASGSCAVVSGSCTTVSGSSYSILYRFSDEPSSVEQRLWCYSASHTEWCFSCASTCT